LTKALYAVGRVFYWNIDENIENLYAFW